MIKACLHGLFSISTISYRNLAAYHADLVYPMKKISVLKLHKHLVGVKPNCIFVSEVTHATFPGQWGGGGGDPPKAIQRYRVVIRLIISCKTCLIDLFLIRGRTFSINRARKFPVLACPQSCGNSSKYQSTKEMNNYTYIGDNTKSFRS